MNKCAVLGYRGDLGFKLGPLEQQSNALPLRHIPRNMVTHNTT